jgi:hypothetical protein
MERQKGVTIMNKAIIPLVFTILFSTLAHAQMEIYSWQDKTGTIHIVDDLNKVPLHYREDMKIYRIPPARVEKEPRSKPSVRAATRVEEGEEEGALEEERLGEEIEEVRGSIIGLEDRLEELKQGREKMRLYIIKKRAKGNPVVREKRELDGIDREIEILTNQLGKRIQTLRLLEQGRSLQRSR